MVIGYHIILGAYGFWLPNDPRGSWSTEVRAEHLRPFGPATKVSTRRSVADRKHDHRHRLAAKRQLKYPPVRFSGLQARAVGRGFAKAIEHLQLAVHACSIMPDHAHLVSARHGSDVEYVASFLKRAATRRLTEENLHPFQHRRLGNGRTPSPWADHGWYVYLDTAEQMRQRIRYVEENPLRSGLPRQRWSFVVDYQP